MATEPLDLTLDVVNKAIGLALDGATELLDFRDLKQPYFVLRVRKHSASWFVKTRDNTYKIGNVIPADKAGKLPQRRQRASKSGDKFLNLRDARAAAKLKWAELGNPTEPVAEEAPGWTFREAIENYKTRLSGRRVDSKGRVRYRSQHTESDLNIFERPEIAEHLDRPLSELNEDWLEELCEVLHKKYNYSAQRKFHNYINAALNVAKKHYRKKSGLTGRAWWLSAQKRERTDPEIAKKEEDNKKLDARKRNFRVEHLGDLLMRHEVFCLSRFGNERVSPGVRWGLWWTCLMGHRRGSATVIVREDIKDRSEYPRLPKGWGVAIWQPQAMKTHDEFALPIPPLGMHIITCCERDYKEANQRVGRDVPSPWVFTSRVVGGKRGIIPVTGSALANHIRSMRGQRNDGNIRNILEGMPHFNMHLIRSTVSSYIAEEPSLPEGTASLIINHDIPGDRAEKLGRMSETSKIWYVKAQRIPQKLEAMKVWSDALLKAFLDAGGLYPN